MSLNEVVELHEAGGIKADSLKKGWRTATEYLTRALSLVDLNEPNWLGRDSVWEIKEELGPPPTVAQPLYLISVGEKSDEKLVYVGKTSSNSSRFSGGHAAITKLHAPKYRGKRKRIYLASIMFYDTIDYLPIELVSDLKRAEELLSSIEAHLIYDLQPELNTSHKKSFGSRWPMQTIFENHIDETAFLHDVTLYVPKSGGKAPPIWSEEEIGQASKISNGMFS